MAEPAPNEDQSTSSGFQSDATGAELMAMLLGAVQSDPAGVTGADRVANLISLTQAEYDAITPDASTLYIIT
jgi:hypothetical protein